MFSKFIKTVDKVKQLNVSIHELIGAATLFDEPPMAPRPLMAGDVLKMANNSYVVVSKLVGTFKIEGLTAQHVQLYTLNQKLYLEAPYLNKEFPAFENSDYFPLGTLPVGRMPRFVEFLKMFASGSNR
jgi:hypothetical protein